MKTMKRIICAILCGIMLVCAAGSLAAASYTLPEKMEKQLSIGSGLKGEVTIHGEGTHPIILALQPFQDVELQFRGLRTGEEAHYYAYQAGEGEEQKGLTEIYMNGDQTWVRSDLLPGEVYQIPTLEKAAEKLLPAAGGNPSVASAAIRWLRLSGEERSGLLDPLVKRLSGPLEMWAARFVTVSDVRTLENGTSVVDLVYDIPMTEMKQEIVGLMNQVIESEEGQRLLDAVLNEEQKAVFANRNLDYYYTEALSALDNHFDVMYTQTVSTLGNFISSTLELPLDGRSMGGYEALVIEQENGLITCTLHSEEQDITLQMPSAIDWEQISSFSAWICIRPGSADVEAGKRVYRALRADVSRDSELTTDEENRDHLRENWAVFIERDITHLPEGEEAFRYQDETPLEASLNLHYYSRYSQSSPTTLEIEAKVSRGQQSVSAAGMVKTATPWTITPFDTEGAVEISTLSRQQMVLKAAEILAAAGEKLTPVEKTNLEEQKEEAVPAEGSAETEEAGQTEETAETEETNQAEKPATEEPGQAEDPATTEETPSAEEAEGAESI